MEIIIIKPMHLIVFETERNIYLKCDSTFRKKCFVIITLRAALYV